MHEILSLALVVLGYTSPLDYSHINLWIMWGRPRVQKKMVFPSANKIFSRLSVGIWMYCHCSGVPCIFLFCRLSIPIPLQCWCRQTPCQSCAEWQNSAGRQGQQGSAAPSLGGEHGSGCRHVDKSFPTAQCSVNPPVSGSSLRSPTSEAVTTSAKGKHLHSLFWPCLCLWRKIIWQQHSTVRSWLVSVFCAFPGNSRSWERNRFHPHWHSMSNLAACSSLTYFNNNGHLCSLSLGAAILY